ncbi:MAG: hypothetical protein KF778_15150 [Rhodocyclaceae bacterium]|nr:hypothetical protein [Rhodocyclaceae bacterium]MBX3669736.1 hypothetical protein [Rhodocyclaceae bacterium]
MLPVHDLHAEFPESATLIRLLNQHNQYFASLFDEFDQVNRRVREAERLGLGRGDLGALLARRGALKEQLRDMLSGEPA